MASECNKMFDDRFDTLTMKEIGIELKHFMTGTAPESPSFLVNQEELKKELVEKFRVFFDEDKSQGLEIVFLKSNYGNGKSHFIRMIYTFLNEYENVFVRKVSFKQEETDLKKIILECISQKKLKECACFLVDMAEKEALSRGKDAVISSIGEKYSVGAKLSQILYEAARSTDITRQIQAMAILRGTYLPDYLKNFDCRNKDMSDEFFYDVIELLSIYLKEARQYIVVVLDEYEHVFSWKSNMARKKLYVDIKWFTEGMDSFSNLFFVFGESESAESRTEIRDDPAWVSRKPNLTCQIADISSEGEVERLFEMILKRYQKYYSVSFEEHKDDILKMVGEDSMVKAKTNYRSYTQAIMRALDEFRNNPSGLKRKKDDADTNEKNISKENMTVKEIGDVNDRILKWKNATSITKKTMLCEVLEAMLQRVNEEVLSKSKKKGEYVTRIGNVRNLYYVVSTENPSLKDLKKRYDTMVKELHDGDSLYVLYPAIQGTLDVEDRGMMVFYDETTAGRAFEAIHDGECDTMYSYLNILNVDEQSPTLSARSTKRR